MASRGAVVLWPVVLWALAAGAACDDGPAGPADASADGAVDGSTDGALDGAVVVPCVEDAECDDGAFCNGVERCIGGACENGEAPACAGVVGCEMGACSEEDDACVMVALDADGDGEAPEGCGGEDCDDGDGATRRGAVERCNGRDDDCDDRADESVATRVIAALHTGAPSVAAHGAETFVAWAEQVLPPAPGPRAVVARLNAGGIDVGRVDLGLAAAAPSVVAGDDVLGLAWVAGCDGPECTPTLRFARLGWGLERLGAERVVGGADGAPGEPEVVRLGDGWAVLWAATTGDEVALRLARLAADGAPVGAAVTLSPAEAAPRHHAALWTGAELVVAWTAVRDGVREVLVARLAADGEVTGLPTAPHPSGGASVGHPTLDWTGEGLGLAWESDAGHAGRFDVLFAPLDAAGRPAGEPRVVSGALGEGSAATPQLLWDGGHHVVVWRHEEGDVESIYVARLERTGAIRDEPVWIDRAAGSASRPRATRPPDGLAVVWGGDYLDRFEGRGMYVSRVCAP